MASTASRCSRRSASTRASGSRPRARPSAPRPPRGRLPRSRSQELAAGLVPATIAARSSTASRTTTTISRAALAWLIAPGTMRPAPSDPAGRDLAILAGRGHMAEGLMRAGAVLAMPGLELPRRPPASRARAAGGMAYWSADIFLRASPLRRCARACPGDRRQAGDRPGAARPPASRRRLATSSEEWAAQLAEGSARAGEALALFRELGDERGAAWALWGLGEAAIFSAQWTAAEGVVAEGMGHFERLDDPFGQGWALFTRGTARHAEGHLDTAATRPAPRPRALRGRGRRVGHRARPRRDGPPRAGTVATSSGLIGSRPRPRRSRTRVECISRA